MKLSNLLLVGALLSVAADAFASQVSDVQVKAAAETWLRGGRALDSRMGTGVESVEPVTVGDGISFWIVRLKGSGYLVMSAETSVEPVLAYSSSGELRTDGQNPLWVLLRGDAVARMRGEPRAEAEIKWKRLLEEGERRRPVLLSSVRRADGPADVRVDALLETAWSQMDCGDWGSTDESDICYNYYTPNHWPCGCVATVGAQLMRYHRHPLQAVTPAAYLCAVGEEVSPGMMKAVPTELSMLGGAYAWDDMAAVPSAGCSAAGREAIGRLTYDVGVSCKMTYMPGSGTGYFYLLSKRLVDRFQYANAAGVTFKDGSFYPTEFRYSLTRLKAAVIPNLDAHLPVALALVGDGGSHAVLCDGYGYADGDFYIHVNLGLADRDGGNAWYLPPDIDKYDIIDSIVYNVYPKGEPGASIVSGRILSADGTGVAGATVTATARGETKASAVSDGTGIYALFVPPGSYAIAATRDGMRSPATSVDVKACISSDYTDAGTCTSRIVPNIGNVYGVDLILQKPVFRFDGNGATTGEMPDAEVSPVDFPLNRFVRTGYEFAGWARVPQAIDAEWEDGEVPDVMMFDPGSEIYMLYAVWRRMDFSHAVVDFCSAAVLGNENDSLAVRVSGGNMDLASSVQVQVMYNTAAAADLNLKNATVNGEKPKSFKFPVTLEWAKGEIGDQTIEIPVAVDKAVEADEFLTLQLANPMNLAIGEASFCTVTIRGPGQPVVGKSYVRALANDATRGKVTGSALAADGKNMTLKATANKGWTFAGWYTDPACAAGHELTGYGDYRNPSLSYPNTNGAVTVYARFITPEEDGLELDADFLPAEFAVGDAVSIEVPVESVSYPTVKVAGLPSGLKYYEKETFVKAKGTTPAYTIPANTIYGAPTKTTTKPAAVTVTVKNLGGYQITRKYEVSVVATAPSPSKAKVVSDAAHYYSVAVALSDDFAGKATGAGMCQAGKKVTLKATANKGYVFSEWSDGDALVSRLASYAFTMPSNDVSFTAKFVTAEEDQASIAAEVNGMAFGAGSGGEGAAVTKLATNVMTGVYLEWPVAASALSLPTVKVAGLPGGLKFTTKPVTTKVTSGSGAAKVTTVVTNVAANTIYGAPTKASTVDNYGEVKPSTVKVTVTTAGKSKADYVISLTVDPIPGFAVGTFDGWYGDGEDVLGSATLTLASNGKVSGKVLMPVDGKGKTYNFSAASLSGFSRADDGSVTNVTVAATLTGENKAAVPLALTFAPDEIGIGCVEGAFDSPWSGGLWLGQNGWKRGGDVFPNIPKNIVKTLDDGLTLTFKKNGVVSIGGKIVGDDGVTLVSVKGSSQLVSDPESADGFLLFVYVPPAKNLVSGFCRLYDVKLIDAAVDNVVTDVKLVER